MFCCDIDDWRADGYRWFQNGTKLVPRREPKVRKIYFVSLTQDGQNKEFVRHAFYLVDGDQKNVLVHYIGDESTASEFPHGNAKTRHNFYRTCPSVLRKMSSEHDAPGTVYKSYVSGSVCPVKYQPSLVPRNSKQVINLQ